MNLSQEKHLIFELLKFKNRKNTEIILNKNSDVKIRIPKFSLGKICQGTSLSCSVIQTQANTAYELFANLSREQLILELVKLQQEVEHLHSEKNDLEIVLETTAEHADGIETQLRSSYREIGRLCRELAVANQELKRLAHCDALTGLANRRRFDQYLEQAWQRLTHHQQPLSLILCDVDFFKRYNDAYGHPAGDECLREVARSIRQAVKRSSDLVARYGGEEMAVILPNTDAMGALSLAQAIGERVASLQLPHEGSKVSQYVTISLGVACHVPHGSLTCEVLIADADAALYEAKRTGRDRAILCPKNW
jgi:diguanylate cyclase (GGDEF)-like protein